MEDRKGQWYSETVQRLDDAPRSYWVRDDTNNKLYRRNSRHLRPTKTTIKKEEWNIELPNQDPNQNQQRPELDQSTRQQPQQQTTLLPFQLQQATPGPVQQQHTESAERFQPEEGQRTTTVVTRSGRVVKPPEKLNL